MKIKTIKIFALIIFMASCTQHQKNKMNLDKAYDLSVEAETEEQLQEALKIYGGIIEQKIYAQKRMAVVYHLLADRSLAMEQYGYAAKYFTEALKITPTKTSLHYGLGISYANLYESSTDENQKKNFLAKAESSLKYSIEKDSENPNYYAALATVVGIYKGDYNEAMKYITKALSYNANNVEFLFILARLQYQLENYNDSINTYNLIIKLSPDSYNTRQNAENNIKQIMQLANSSQ